MDRSADFVSLGIVQERPGLTFRLAGLLSLVVAALLAAARMIWHLPNQLLLVGAVVFALSLLCWFAVHRRTSRPKALLVFGLLSTWVLVSGILLGSLYHVDRAGWLWFQITGYNSTLAEEFPGSQDLSSAEFVQRHRAFKVDPTDSTRVILRSGNHSFDQTVVVPRGIELKIEPGTTLRFKGGHSLISYGPVDARGTKNLPIVLTAQNQWLKWGVLGVVNEGKSVFEYVRFMHGRQALVNGIDFFGCLTLVGGQVEIRNCRFTHLFGKDGVNVRQAQVLIQDNLFRDTFKDGLDLDAGTGEISRNRFIDCQDEGIDLSENRGISVFDNEILDSKGGRVGADHDLEEIRARNTLGYSTVARQARAVSTRKLR